MFGDKEAFSRDLLDALFGIDAIINYHPSLPKLIAAPFYAAFKDIVGPFRAFRLSAPFLFGILLAAIYIRSSIEWGRIAGIGAALCTALMPRFFIDNHIGGADAPLGVFWLFSFIAFEAACKRNKLSPIAGIACGLAACTKFTGLVVCIPLIIWGIVYYRRKAVAPAIFSILFTPLVFIAFHPGLYHAPIDGLFQFFKSSTNRASWLPLWVMFRGTIYIFSAPWYYAPYMTAITTPVSILVLFIIGVIKFFMGPKSMKDRLSGACLINFTFIIGLTFSPKAPTFDGVRLFLPAFIFMGILGGLGFESVVSWIGKKRGAAAKYITATILIGCMIVPFARIYPYGEEYYNSLIGGVGGARKHGMETTYWWTALNEKALDRVNKTVPQNASIRFIFISPPLYELYKELGLLRPDIRVVEDSSFDYAVVLSRPYWDFKGIYMYLGANLDQLERVDGVDIAGVPLWVLYKKRR